MPEKMEMCPCPPKKTETIKKAPEKSKNKPQQQVEKFPKSERLQNLEGRLKETAWRIVGVDTNPTYRPASPSEKTKYANLSDKAAEAKGVIRRYDEQGALFATEILETTDHKVTLELGGKTFIDGLPKATRDYMKSVGKANGPYIRLSNILVAADGSVDPTAIKIRVTDKDYSLTSYVDDLEQACKGIISEEHGLTPKAFTEMEKIASQFYQEQTAIDINATDIEEWEKLKKVERDEKAQKANDEEQEKTKKTINQILSNWFRLAHNALGSYVQAFHDEGVGYGVSWNLYDGDLQKVMPSVTTDQEGKLKNIIEIMKLGVKYDLKIYIDLSAATIGKIEFYTTNSSPKLGLTDVKKNLNKDGSQTMTSIFQGKRLSYEVLMDIKDYVLYNLIAGVN